MTCKNCSAEATLNYCPNCGHPAKLKRIDSHYIFHEIVHILHFEKGFLYTIRELSIRPGSSVRQFITENRNRLVKPVIFIILASLIYTIISHFFHLEEETTKQLSGKPSAVPAIFKWIQNHYGYANMIMGIFIALWVKLFFRKNGYNIFEILILLCFTMGIGMLILSLFGILQGLTHINLSSSGSLAGILYCSWAIAQFFDKSKFVNYIKAFFAYLLGFFSSLIVAILIGVAIDLVNK